MILVWVDFIIVSSVRKIEFGLGKDLICSKGALTCTYYSVAAVLMNTILGTKGYWGYCRLE